MAETVHVACRIVDVTLGGVELGHFWRHSSIPIFGLYEETCVWESPMISSIITSEFALNFHMILKTHQVLQTVI